jgi:hypothetical protein
MELLTREQIKNASDIKKELVKVPEWGGNVLVWGLTGTERDAFDESNLTRGKRGRLDVRIQQARVRLVIMACRDEQGNQIFTDADAEWLSAKSAAALARVHEVASRLSGLTDGEIEEQVKN